MPHHPHQTDHVKKKNAGHNLWKVPRLYADIWATAISLQGVCSWQGKALSLFHAGHVSPTCLLQHDTAHLPHIKTDCTHLETIRGNQRVAAWDPGAQGDLKLLPLLGSNTWRNRRGGGEGEEGRWRGTKRSNSRCAQRWRKRTSTKKP